MDHATPAVWLFFVLFTGFILLQIARAKTGKPIFLRKIAGLEAIDDAIGRATEMGRPIMFNLGMDDLGAPLFASLACMKHVVSESAELDMPVLVPVAKPLAYPLAEEYWKEAYSEAGRPNLYRADECVRYMSDQQAAFAAATAGWIDRDRPGAHFMFGFYGWESLFIAESAQKVGAIQVAATYATYQVPFLLLACDYTAFGEEFFAAGAYFSRDPLQLGSVVGQDYSKAVLLLLIIVGSLLAILYPTDNPLAALLVYQ